MELSMGSKCLDCSWPAKKMSQAADGAERAVLHGPTARVDQVTEGAAVATAIETNEQLGCKKQERIFQLEQEHKGLRAILPIIRESCLKLRKDGVSESTSLSALVTNAGLSVRTS